MAEKLVTSEGLFTMVEKLLGRAQVTAPREENGIAVFGPVNSAGQVELDGPLPVIPEKSVVFPQSETLLRMDLGGEVPKVEAVEPEGEQVILGVRPCGLQAFARLDRVFLEGAFVDPQYRRRRDHTLIIALTCPTVKRSCFCRAFGYGPSDGSGADLQLTRLPGGSFHLETLTERGGEFVAEMEKEGIAGLTDAGAEAGSAARAEKARVERLAERSAAAVSTEGVVEGLDGMYDDPYWAQLAERCISCGICTYLCPTCHCFDICEKARGPEAERYRCWDTCLFSNYTLMAGGANPRPTVRERLRNRLYHKLNFFNHRYGEFLCVGCGRCVEHCPTNIDIRKVMAKAAARSRAQGVSVNG
ncbi:MAG: 4Fe-4S dicluster domain-containing protein [Firmicutes bacterium]|nr:4Fe-4S dicluster domain-containing protein [Bacillota bacterium]